MDRKTRGFRLRHRLGKICFKWWQVGTRRRKNIENSHLSSPSTGKSHVISKLFTFLRSFQRVTKPNYIPISHDHDTVRDPNPIKTPKGYLAVYVGDSEMESERYIVPVIYFNHPLFGELLKEAERVNGFHHPGRITIPCEVSEFEKVKKRIASSENSRRRWWNRRRNGQLRK